MKLRVSINHRRINGPYGGGSHFARALEKYLLTNGHEVCRELVRDLDLILIAGASKSRSTVSYTLDEIIDYRLRYPNVAVVMRVNDSDEAYGRDTGRNATVLASAERADHVVFLSRFIRELHLRHGLDPERPWSVIHNGADESIFNPDGRATWQPSDKLKLVTHHWAPNYTKGFDIYERLDLLLQQLPYRDRFEFTYVGRLPLGLPLKNTHRIPPLHGRELAANIKEHHLYITAARNEAGGYHYIEAMRCGLPVLYLNSGSLPEYCAPYGIEFTLVNFEQKLMEAHRRFEELHKKVLECPYTARDMSAQYEKLFLKLVAQRHAQPLSSPRRTDLLRLTLRSCRKKLGRIRRALCSAVCR